jgi:hypothetical protein
LLPIAAFSNVCAIIVRYKTGRPEDSLSVPAGKVYMVRV